VQASQAIAVPLVRGLSLDETTRLEHGETIIREQTIDHGGTRYVGGVTYTILETSPEGLAQILDDMTAWQRVLPRTKRARLVGQNDGDSFVELRQGNSLVEAKYTLRVRKNHGGREGRFWLDPSRPHGIDDAWGFFRAEPLAETAGGQPRVLLTY